ncbi:MAG: hypothetical protein LJE64_08795 [Desulfofustis sp.]|jgi:predicted lipoprotein|nr:hypothetical protein [Desulfofustis sp.]
MMRTVLTFLLLVIPTSLMAANPPAMNQGNMQNMMQAMQQVQQCMEKIDQSKLEDLQAQSDAFKKEVDSLCTAGKRDEAQKRAMKFAQEAASNPVMKQMRECGELAKGVMPMMEGLGAVDETQYENTHVCDQ